MYSPKKILDCLWEQDPNPRPLQELEQLQEEGHEDIEVLEVDEESLETDNTMVEMPPNIAPKQLVDRFNEM